MKHHRIFDDHKIFLDYAGSKFQEGYNAFWDEKDHTDNPYCVRNGFYCDTKRPDDTECYYLADVYWFRGWRFADLENSEGRDLLKKYYDFMEKNPTCTVYTLLDTNSIELHRIVRNWINLGCHL